MAQQEVDKSELYFSLDPSFFLYRLDGFCNSFRGVCGNLPASPELCQVVFSDWPDLFPTLPDILLVW